LTQPLFDGKWIAFSSGRTGFKDESALHPYNPQPYGEICVLRADGSDVHVLTITNMKKQHRHGCR